MCCQVTVFGLGRLPDDTFICVVLVKELDILSASVDRLELLNRQLTALIAHNIYWIHLGQKQGGAKPRRRAFQVISPKSNTPSSSDTKTPARRKLCVHSHCVCVCGVCVCACVRACVVHALCVIVSDMWGRSLSRRLCADPLGCARCCGTAIAVQHNQPDLWITCE